MLISLKRKIYSQISQLAPVSKIGLLVTGAQKAGTTSLHFYLQQHPSLHGSRPKEVGYFSNDFNFSKGEKWYHQHFKTPAAFLKSLRFFESMPDYLYRPEAVERIWKYNPEMKIIIILRDPVKRAYSSWNMYRDFKDNGKPLPEALYNQYLKQQPSNLITELYSHSSFPSFESCIDSEMQKIKDNSPFQEPSFMRRGIYIHQIRRYEERFGKENLCIIGFNDFVSDKKNTLNSILSLMGMEPYDWQHHLKEEEKNVRAYPESIDPALKKRLTAFYEPYNQELTNYLGYAPNW